MPSSGLLMFMWKPKFLTLLSGSSTVILKPFGSMRAKVGDGNGGDVVVGSVVVVVVGTVVVVVVVVEVVVVDVVGSLNVKDRSVF